MTRHELKRKLQKQMIRFRNNGSLQNLEFWVMMNKFNQVPDEILFDYQSKGTSIYHFINGLDIQKINHKPRKTSQNTGKKTYYKLENSMITRITEKAIGITVGTNNHVGTGYREYIEWIPESQVIKIDSKNYIPAWLISKNGLWQFVDKNDKIVK